MYCMNANDLKLKQSKLASSTEDSEAHASIIIRENLLYATLLKANPLHVLVFSLLPCRFRTSIALTLIPFHIDWRENQMCRFVSLDLLTVE